MKYHTWSRSTVPCLTVFYVPVCSGTSFGAVLEFCGCLDKNLADHLFYDPRGEFLVYWLVKLWCTVRKKRREQNTVTTDSALPYNTTSTVDYHTRTRTTNWNCNREIIMSMIRLQYVLVPYFTSTITNNNSLVPYPQINTTCRSTRTRTRTPSLLRPWRLSVLLSKKKNIEKSIIHHRWSSKIRNWKCNQ